MLPAATGLELEHHIPEKLGHSGAKGIDHQYKMIMAKIPD